MAKFPFFNQLDAMDCGPSCLRMIAKHYGKNYTLETLRKKSYITREGVSLLGVSDAAESIGFRSMGARVDFEQLSKQVKLPAIVHWNQNHFIVVYKITKKKVFVADPSLDACSHMGHDEFLRGWTGSDSSDGKGLCLILETSPDFYSYEDEQINKSSPRFLLSYLKPYRRFFTQLLLSVFFGSLIQLVFPFLTQAIVDIGINNQNTSFIVLVLLAQAVLFISRISVDFIRGWILLHISSRMNISLLSDFLIKLMKLPIGYFDVKKIGDLMQRISDHRRIENFITTSSLSALFSVVNILVFGIILLIYSLKIFLVFMVGSLLYFLWVRMFLKQRREIDNKRFKQNSDNQNGLIQLINGMQEIKLNNAEKQKRWKWEHIQAKLFRLNVRSLALSQYQRAGASFFNESKNILITFFAAIAVTRGEMTLGMMLAVQFIIGQLNSPIDQLLGVMNKFQDARLSLERLGEIHNEQDEEEDADQKLNTLPTNKSFRLASVSFQYDGPYAEYALKNVDLEIPQNKVTAIVGTSGSGKTTLMKLLMGFYQPTIGEIRMGDIHLSNFNEKIFRKHCGAVMQEGFVFSDSIRNNIIIGDEFFDHNRFMKAVDIACLNDFVANLPQGYNTLIGPDGHGLSQGQKQRILIARAVYKNPDFLFFDEATNALDAHNEKKIMEGLQEFYQNKTVLVIAHRLSTVKHADQIVVLEKGQIVEMGNHDSLKAKKGAYYQLVKEQLELGA